MWAIVKHVFRVDGWFTAASFRISQPSQRVAEGILAQRRAWQASNTPRIKGGPSQYPEEAAALAFFRVPRIKPILTVVEAHAPREGARLTAGAIDQRLDAQNCCI